MKILECRSLPEGEVEASLVSAADAALFEAAREIDRLGAVREAVWVRDHEAPGRSTWPWTDDYEAALDAWKGACASLVNMSAHTVAGAVVKARYLADWVAQDICDWLHEDMARGLLDDLDRLKGAQPSDDMALVALFRDWAAATAEAWAPKAPERKRVRLDRVATEAAKAISALPAASPLGLAIKLHVAWQAHHGSVCDGSADITEPHEAERRTADGNWCQRDALHWSAIKDATRLAGLQDLLSICGDAPVLPAPLASLSPRELLWSALLHVSPGWVEREDHVEVEIEEGQPKRVAVPIVPDAAEITPDTKSPLWPAAEAELTAARERHLAEHSQEDA